nr:hypothetical protein [Tanacetum cinerariifolium]
SSQSPPHINHHCCYECGDLLKGIFCHHCTCKLCGNGAHYGYNCSPKVAILPNPEPFHNQTIKELPSTMQSFDPKPDLVHKSPNVFDPPSQLPFISCEFCENDARYGHYCTPQVPFVYPEQCYNQDFNFLKKKSKLKKIKRLMLDIGRFLLATMIMTMIYQSDEFIKSSVENLVPIPSESDGESECDVPTHEKFTTFSDILFDAEYESNSSDDQSFSDDDVPEKIFSTPLFDEEIIPMKMDQHHHNAESDLMESPRTHDSSLIISSKIDSLLDEFADELALLKSIQPRIDKSDCDFEEDIHLIEKLLYDNSSPRRPKEFVSANSDTETESFAPSPIPVEDSDSLMEESDLSFTPDYPMPPGIEDDECDSERDILVSEDLPSNDTLSIPEKESFYFDIPSFSLPPAKPSYGNTGILNVKMMGDISDQKGPMHKLMITFVPNQEKSPDLLSHRGLKTSQPSAKCPMMIHGKNTPFLYVHLFHFYPLDQFKYGGIWSS